jgi:transposase
MQDERILIGVDVAKDELVIAGVPSSEAVVTVENSAVTIRRWLKTIPTGSSIAMESTGRYHVELARLAYAAGIEVFVLNAKDVWFASQGEGRRGKTDRLDAQVIKNYLEEHIKKLHPWAPGTRQQQRIEELIRRRATIVVHQVAIRKALEGVEGVDRQASSVDKQIARLLGKIDAEVQSLIAQDETMSAVQKRLMTIAGIGPQCSATLTALLERVPFKDVNAFIAFTGLDPRPRDSGKKRGVRVLTKRGPPSLRRLAYLAAFAACHSKAFKPVYKAIRARGFSGTESLVILARKILRVAWAVWRSGMPFDPTKVAVMA